MTYFTETEIIADDQLTEVKGGTKVITIDLDGM